MKNKSIKSHVHQDDGSFVFFYKNTPLIIDPGLKNYLKDDKISRDQLHANSHNSITINGCGIFPPRTSGMSKADIGGISKASLSKDLLHFEMTGFNCLGKPIGWNRKIDTSYDLLKVSDKINSSKSDLIKIIYIFNNGLSFVETEDKILIKSGNEDLAFKIELIDKERNNINDGKYKIYNSFMSKKYGESNLCKTISYSFTANGPVKILSVLKKINVN